MTSYVVQVDPLAHDVGGWWVADCLDDRCIYHGPVGYYRTKPSAEVALRNHLRGHDTPRPASPPAPCPTCGRAGGPK